jgi:penicillin-binding protein 1A
VAVKLSIAIGADTLRKAGASVGENARAGRAKIVEIARRLGITAPLEDTPSLPIGADELSVIEHSAAYAAFVNGGKKTVAYTAVEIRNSRGDILYRHDRDAPPQEQAIPFDKIVELGSMMRKVVEEGTGKRAQLGPAIDVIGKTGTTNGFKDAWFCGYSGLMGGCVWYGNDDGDPMNNMTGGTLPARTWHDIMAYAHQGVAVKPIVGMKPEEPAPSTASTTASAAGGVQALPLGAPQRPAVLSRGAVEALESIDAKIKSVGAKRSEAPRPATVARGAKGFHSVGGVIE